MSKTIKSFELARLAALPGGAVIVDGGEPAARLAAGRTLAASRLCVSKPPCLACRACCLALEGQHIDLIELDASVTKDQVLRVRQLRSGAFIRPHEGGPKIFLLSAAEKLSAASQNALLKVIEEPPSYALFIFLADSAESLLPTIRSRCVRHSLGQAAPVQDEEAATRAAALLSVLKRDGTELELCEALLSWAKLNKEAMTATLIETQAALRHALAAGMPWDKRAVALVKALEEILDAQEYNVASTAVCGRMIAVLTA